MNAVVAHHPPPVGGGMRPGHRRGPGRARPAPGRQASRQDERQPASKSSASHAHLDALGLRQVPALAVLSGRRLRSSPVPSRRSFSISSVVSPLRIAELAQSVVFSVPEKTDLLALFN